MLFKKIYKRQFYHILKLEYFSFLPCTKYTVWVCMDAKICGKKRKEKQSNYMKFGSFVDFIICYISALCMNIIFSFSLTCRCPQQSSPRYPNIQYSQHANFYPSTRYHHQQRYQHFAQNQGHEQYTGIAYCACFLDQCCYIHVHVSICICAHS